jgi:hypothetical protein
VIIRPTKHIAVVSQASHAALIYPTGKSVRLLVVALSSPSVKNIPLVPSGKSNLQLAPSRPTEGRLAIVTDAGRDAVDAEALLDEQR